MQETSRTDIRRLLKAFGIQADEKVSAQMENHPGVEKLHIRLILEDLTDYGDSPPDESLRLELRGEIRR